MIMFVGLGKMLGKSKIRLGVGMRVTKSNSLWMLLLLMFVYMIQATWYVTILILWMIYVLFYGIYWVIKQIVIKLRK